MNLSPGAALQKYLDKVTLGLSKGGGGGHLSFFLYFVFTKQKLGRFRFIIFLLEIKVRNEHICKRSAPVDIC